MNEMIYEVGCKVYLSAKHKIPFKVLFIGSHGQDCTVPMITYTNMIDTDNKKAGHIWSIEESIFLNRFVTAAFSDDIRVTTFRGKYLQPIPHVIISDYYQGKVEKHVLMAEIQRVHMNVERTPQIDCKPFERNEDGSFKRKQSRVNDKWKA